MELLVEEGRSWLRRVQKRYLGIFRLLARPALPCLTTCPPHSGGTRALARYPGTFWSSCDIEEQPLLIGHDTASPLHPLGKGARLLQSCTGIRHRSIYYGEIAGQGITIEGHCPASVSVTY
jgi:hypothetical protein